VLEKEERDKVCWNMIIGLCPLHGFYEEALRFFRRMVEVVLGFEPNLVTVDSMLPMCA